MTIQAQVVTNHVVDQANLIVSPKPNPSNLASRIRGLMRINPLTFHSTKVHEDQQDFIDEMFKVVYYMGVTPREKAESAACELKDVAQDWFEQWRDERPFKGRSIILGIV